MLILEGPDAAGKTTLAKKLLRHLPGSVYAHFTRLPPAFDYHYGYLDRASADIVQDRFHLSELAYAVARGEKPGLCPEAYRLLDGCLRKLGAFTVLLLPTTELVESRWDHTQMYDQATTRSATAAYIHLAINSQRGFSGITPCSLKYPELDPYQPDIDLTIILTEEKPYVDEQDVVEILERYRVRQRTVRGLRRGKADRLKT